jgi:hypothetical protein
LAGSEGGWRAEVARLWGGTVHPIRHVVSTSVFGDDFVIVGEDVLESDVVLALYDGIGATAAQVVRAVEFGIPVVMVRAAGVRAPAWVKSRCLKRASNFQDAVAKAKMLVSTKKKPVRNDSETAAECRDGNLAEPRA